MKTKRQRPVDCCSPQTDWQSAPLAPAPAGSGPATDAHTPCPLVSVPDTCRSQPCFTGMDTGTHCYSRSQGAACAFVCQHDIIYCTFFAASNCSLRISDPFSLISFSRLSREDLRSRERSPWSLPDGGPAWPPPSTLRSGSRSRSIKLHTFENTPLVREDKHKGVIKQRMTCLKRMTTASCCVSYRCQEAADVNYFSVNSNKISTPFKIHLRTKKKTKTT